MLITQLLSQAEAQYGSLFFLVARRYGAIPNTHKTAGFLNTLAPSPAYYIAATRDADRQNNMRNSSADAMAYAVQGRLRR
ncbi:gp106 [Erwinia phage vB_EamP-S6]|uniref:Gp106 n=1 Tax=Erwinia phage vB_EamP-S6 TaxID=1051675 RepID=G0YQJ8_9CAUD|nr:gp106 [Erwinia phage vB_EamP-S6]AEJ81625.1 gp106 [Erwinia phage vB_EamP-S6]